MQQPQQSLATWNGDIIVGGEPAWFGEAASRGLITRSCEGVGPCLVVKAGAAYDIIMPGDTLQRSDDGTIKRMTLDATIRTLREIPRSPPPLWNEGLKTARFAG